MKQIRPAIRVGTFSFDQHLFGQHLLDVLLKEVLCLTVEAIGHRFRLGHAQRVNVAVRCGCGGDDSR